MVCCKIPFAYRCERRDLIDDLICYSIDSIVQTVYTVHRLLFDQVFRDEDKIDMHIYQTCLINDVQTTYKALIRTSWFDGNHMEMSKNGTQNDAHK